jgi:signal transduction histidine kinase
VLKTLHGRLAAALLLLLLVTGVFDIFLTLKTTELHQQEVAQSMSQGLAEHLAEAKHETFLTSTGEIRSAGLNELFHWFMVVNPGVEFYLLDPQGKILAYDAMPGKVKREQVDLGPIHSFLEHRDRLPIFGDDPRHDERRKVFSVSTIPPPSARAKGEDPKGYLYVVLASEQMDSTVDLLKESYILRLSSWTLAAYLLLATLAGLFLFRYLTRPLRQLAGRIHNFKASAGESSKPINKRGDEVEDLSITFDAMAQRIKQQLEEISRVESHRRELIANVSHDLRTPIASLQGYLDTLMLKDSTLSSDERSEYLSIALSQSERLGKLVQELFELTKLDHQTSPLELESFSLNELVQDNLQRCRLQAKQKNIELKAEFDPSIPFVVGNLGLLERALQNLLENALRCTPPDGAITVRLAARPKAVRVEVADTGHGIPSDILPHIFERFYRWQKDGEHPQGTGLGLAITKRILELHQSEINVESQPGKGTTFSFALAIGSLATPTIE